MGSYWVIWGLRDLTEPYRIVGPNVALQGLMGQYGPYTFFNLFYSVTFKRCIVLNYLPIFQSCLKRAKI